MELLDALNWRYATKKMNGEAVSEDKIQNIIEAIRLTPTSSGLQPFKIFVITDPELKAKIQPIAYGQTQIVDGSHLIVFAAWDKFTQERIDEVFNFMNTERGLPLNTTDDYKANLSGMLLSLPEEGQAALAAKQAYIAFGTAIAAAALQKVDATPMEGFDKAQLDELLGLGKIGLKSTTILALGYRDEANDWLVNMKKVRVPESEFVTKL